MKFNRMILGGVVACAASRLCVAAVPYANDFATRTSGPVQTGAWYTNSYVVGQCAVNYTGEKLVPTSALAYGKSDQIQDNWMKVTQDNGGTFAINVIPGIQNNSANEAQGTDNQFFRFGNSIEIVKSTGVAQSFFNSFTNGVLRLYADLRAPTNWPAGNGYVRIQPLYRAALETPVWASGSKQTRAFMNFGLQKQQNTTGHLASSMLLVYKGNGSGGNAIETHAHANRHWYRFVIDLDLDKGTYSGKAYDQGEVHPKLADANGTAVWSFSNVVCAWSCQKAGAGPVEGIAIRAADFRTGNPVDRYLETCVDNLVGEWKAPGAESFTRFYENDFTTRRYRTIAPSGTTRHDYVCGTSAAEVQTRPYSAVCASTATNAPYQILRYGIGSLGVNGWKRANTGDGHVAVVTHPGDMPMMRIAGNAAGNGFAVATQTLGEPIRTGRVRMVFDVRTPDAWHWNYHGAYVMMGNQTFWGADNAHFTASIGARWGIGSAQDSANTLFQGYYQESAGAQYDTSVSFKGQTLYLGILTVDLDTRETKGVLYELGADPVTSTYDHTQLTPVWEKTGHMRDGVDEISAIGLGGYGAGVARKDGVVHREFIFFDSVQVWKDWDETAQTGTLVYKDLFSTVTRPLSGPRGTLVGSFNADDGQDHWVRRNNGAGDFWVTGGANPCAAFSGITTHAYATQALGSRYATDKVVVQCDIRPPCSFTWGITKAALVQIGGDCFLQGEGGSLNGRRFYDHGSLASFGFGTDDTGRSECGDFPTKKLRFYDGDGAGSGTVPYRAMTPAIASTHWYRFKAVLDMRARTYDVTVYDQGTAHPTAASPNGTQIHVEKGLGFRAPATEAVVSAICLNAYGAQAQVANDPEDRGLVLYDNLKVSTPSGLCIVVR